MTARMRIILSLGALTLPILLVAPNLDVTISWPQAQAQSAKKLKAEDEEMRQSMIVMSRQLGVTCTVCHNTENFKSEEKLPFKVAKEHVKLTQLLIDNGMDGKNNRPKADCFMCHRGALRPDYREKVDPMQK
jgi:hypothetical protein